MTGPIIRAIPAVREREFQSAYHRVPRPRSARLEEASLGYGQSGCDGPPLEVPVVSPVWWSPWTCCHWARLAKSAISCLLLIVNTRPSARPSSVVDEISRRAERRCRIMIRLPRPRAPEKRFRVGSGAQLADAGTYLDKGRKIRGELFFEGAVRIDGEVDGEISAHDAVIIGETAVVTGQFKAASVVIMGRSMGSSAPPSVLRSAPRPACCAM